MEKIKCRRADCDNTPMWQMTSKSWYGRSFPYCHQHFIQMESDMRLRGLSHTFGLSYTFETINPPSPLPRAEPATGVKCDRVGCKGQVTNLINAPAFGLVGGAYCGHHLDQHRRFLARNGHSYTITPIPTDPPPSRATDGHWCTHQPDCVGCELETLRKAANENQSLFGVDPIWRREYTTKACECGHEKHNFAAGHAGWCPMYKAYRDEDLK